MSHLIETIYDKTIPNAILLLMNTHSLIVKKAIEAQNNLGTDQICWGTKLKRLEISLPKGEFLIGKSNEKFVEVINILATTERTISGLKFLDTKYPDAILQECHASTSDNPDGSDIVLKDTEKNIIVRCEVTDVVSNKPSQNGKESKDLKNLGCGECVPNDLVTRYIVTSSEFANALVGPQRKWNTMHYRYDYHETGDYDGTVLLEIKPSLISKNSSIDKDTTLEQSIQVKTTKEKSGTEQKTSQLRKEYSCPISGCDKVFINSRGGWDSHVESLKKHSDWYSNITDKHERKRLFKKDFPEWFD